MLIILAGITLNAVIGENGIIFQAKDTKNLITNETTYDNAQLAQLQNELKDNGLYSGIGIIPGTDTGGGSEGGENGTGGTNQGGTNNNGGHLVNIGNNQQGTIIGGNAQDPTIRVVEGEMVAAAYYRSDVTVQILTQDKTQKIKYILSTTVPEINKELYPSGLIRELDIENGGTLTFTKDGEYTITAYAYDTQGNKSNPVVMWFKRDTNATGEAGITLIVSGNEGENDWYTSNVTIRVLGTDAGSSRVTYRVTGTVYEKGTIGNYADTYEYEVGEITPREIEIANGTTIKVATDGNFSITAYTYDEVGNRISTSETLNIKRDATRPVINSFTGEQEINSSNVGQGFRVRIDAIDRASGLTSTPYTYQYKLATNTAYDTPTATRETSKLYTGLDTTKTYDMYVMITDEAGNRVTSDIISKPAFWISSNPNQSEGEQINGGKEGSLQYTRSPSIEFSFKGQDSNNVDISKIEYQVEGTATENGTIDGTSYSKDQPVNQIKEYIGQNRTVQTFNLATDGDWTVKVHTYNKEGRKVTTNTIRLCRDTVAPTVTSFEVTTTGYTTADAVVTTDGFGVSGQRTGGGYTYYYGENIQGTKTTATHSYIGMTKTTDFDKELTVQTKDKAGNMTRNIAPTDVKYYLIHRAEIGDYVDYLPGRWQDSSSIPVSHKNVGGQLAGAPIGNGVDGKHGWVISDISSERIKLLTISCPILMFCSEFGDDGEDKMDVQVPKHSGSVSITKNTSYFQGDSMWTLDEGYYDGVEGWVEYVNCSSCGKQYGAWRNKRRKVYRMSCFPEDDKSVEVPTEIFQKAGTRYSHECPNCKLWNSFPAIEFDWWRTEQKTGYGSYGTKGIRLECDIEIDVLTDMIRSHEYGSNNRMEDYLGTNQKSIYSGISSIF